jgi:hypothetical protein
MDNLQADNRLKELKARMEEIRDQLTELDEKDRLAGWDDARIREQITALQNEGKRLGDEFRRIREEQKRAVEFARKLLNQE